MLRESSVGRRFSSQFPTYAILPWATDDEPRRGKAKEPKKSPYQC
ncbi:hypothetical protein TIFTF001_021335 [Ficus carica]|uniref:Uncharacterized protein n=1 Tax=Ficus carica TaxID=3494 RepID=A0AA88AGI4_FICCA|nr:hypothetical protein TIFTF001_021335 [Ficus carica]